MKSMNGLIFRRIMMNDRIHELALEVFSFKYKTSPDELNPGHHMDHIHKFAELIVRECAQKLEDDGMVEVAMEIKEYFRVE